VTPEELGQAVERLMREHEKKVWGIAKGFARTDADAADIFQETWLNVLTSLGSRNPSDPAGAWIGGVAVMTAKNYLRRQARTKNPGQWLWQEMVSAFRSNDTRLPVGNSATAQLWAAMGELTARQRSIFELAVLEDRPLEEIAQRMNIKLGTVKATKHQVREKLRKKLEHLADRWQRNAT